MSLDLSLRALILAPTGRDAQVARATIERVGIPAEVCANVTELVEGLQRGAATAIIAEEALRGDSVAPLAHWLDAQPRWSDFPFVAFLSRAAAEYSGLSGGTVVQMLRNVTLLERPVQAVTLVSAVHAAQRARRRQYEVAAYLGQREKQELALRQLNESLERRVMDRTAQLANANQRLLTEIEERRRTEDALRQAQKLQALGQLTGGIAHDFNNLLTVVSGNLELLLPKLVQPQLHRLGAAAQRAVERATSLTQQLLAFSRKQHLEPSHVDLNKIVRGMAEMLSRSAGEHCRIHMTLPEDKLVVLADPNQLETALLNLVLNARDAMPEGGEIEIATREVEFGPQDAARAEIAPGSYVELLTRDTGCGMSQDVMAQAFEPFFTTKDIGQGSGLGLSMVYGFVRQSHGYVMLESDVGRGTAVRIFLPRAELESAQGWLSAPSPGRTAWPTPPSLQKVLVVEDNADVRAIAVSILAEFGFTVIEASDAATALALLAEDPGIAVVFSDVVMPGAMNGIDLARAIAARWPDLRCILTSGYAERLVGSERIAPQVSYLRKPYKPLELVGAVASVLSGSRGEGGAQLRG